jgi:hypothetical protein
LDDFDNKIKENKFDLEIVEKTFLRTKALFDSTSQFCMKSTEQISLSNMNFQDEMNK